MNLVPTVSSEDNNPIDPPEVDDKLKNKNSSVDNERAPLKKTECIDSTNQTYSTSPATFKRGDLPPSPAEDEYKRRHKKIDVGDISRQNRVANQTEIRNKKKQSKLQKRRGRPNDFNRDNEFNAIAKDGLFGMGNVDDVQDTVNFAEQNESDNASISDDSSL